MKEALILIPPSEGKSSGGQGAVLGKASADVSPIIEKLKNVRSEEWGKILGVKGDKLERSIEANERILKSPTMPAIERYTGVVYNAIDYPSMPSADRKRFNLRVRIVSAVFGLVQPLDPIPEYKLKIDKLGADKYWRPINAAKLKDVFVIDLLPRAHQKAVSYDNGIFVDFMTVKNGKRKPAGHSGKHIKGRFIRWLCSRKEIDPSDFSSFAEDGFIWTDESVFLKHS